MDNLSLLRNYAKQIFKESGLKLPHALLVEANSFQARRLFVVEFVKHIMSQTNTKLSDFSLNNYELLEIRPDQSNNIKLIQVSGLLNWASRKKTDTIKKQIIIIHESQRLTKVAQNVLLRVLEEPPSNCHFILSTDSRENLISTVTSRCQQLKVPQLNKDQFGEYYLKIFPQKSTSDIDKFYSIYQGDIFSALEPDTNLEEYEKSIDETKKLLQTSLGESIINSQSFSKNREMARNLIENLILISRSVIHNTKNRNQLKTWADRLEFCLDSLKLIDQNLNLKLIIDRVLLEFRI